MKHIKNIVVVVLCLSFSLSIYAYANEIYEHDDLSRIAASLKSVRNATTRAEALKILNKNISVLDTYSVDAIKKSRSYEALGSLYMYYGFLLDDDNKKIDEAIKAFNKALAIRSEPNSHKELATIYKKRYDKAIESDNSVDESFYGEKVYYHLKQYMRLGHVTSDSWKERLSYFEAYASQESLQVKSKK